MADNVGIIAGDYEATIATDDIGGIHHQRAKVTWGPDGTANDADVASGKPLPVQLRASTGGELALALDATLTGGTAKAIARGAAKGATVAADATVSAVDADHAAVDVFVRGGAAAGGTSSTFGATFPAAGTAIGGSDGTNMLATRVTTTTPATGLAGFVVHPKGWATPAGDSMVNEALAALQTTLMSQLDSTTSAAGVSGEEAHDAPITKNPVLLGAYANLNEPAEVSTVGDLARLWGDMKGRLVVLLGHANPEAPVTVNATASGDTDVIATPGASVSLHIVRGTVFNGGAAPVVVALQEDGSATSRWSAELGPEGGGAGFNFGSRGWKLTANTGLDVNLSATGDVRINVDEFYVAP